MIRGPRPQGPSPPGPPGCEDIPWQCRRLVIGTGVDGALPVLPQVHDEARRRKVDLVILPTAQAIRAPAQTTKDTNAILHLTC